MKDAVGWGGTVEWNADNGHRMKPTGRNRKDSEMKEAGDEVQRYTREGQAEILRPISKTA